MRKFKTATAALFATAAIAGSALVAAAPAQAGSEIYFGPYTANAACQADRSDALQRGVLKSAVACYRTVEGYWHFYGWK